MKYIYFIIFYLLSIVFLGFVYYFNLPFIGINFVLPTAFCVIGYILIQKKWYKIFIITIFCCISIIGSILVYEALLEWKLSTLGIDVDDVFLVEEITEEQGKYMSIRMNSLGRNLAKMYAIHVSLFLSFFGFLISKIILKLRNNKKYNSLES